LTKTARHVVAAVFAVVCLGEQTANARLTVTLAALTAPGYPVGGTLFFKATVEGTDPHVYRFRVGRSGSTLRVVRDFAPRTHLDWTPLEDGPLEVEVTARNTVTSETATATTTYMVGPRVTAGVPVVSPTLHPLVALYSAPPCAAGTMRVRFAAQGGGREQFTPFKPCIPGRSVNFYVGGLYADTAYDLRSELVNTGTTLGPVLTYRTPVVTTPMPPTFVIDPLEDPGNASQEMVLHGMIMMSTPHRMFPMATDSAGRVLWYYDKSMHPWQTGANLLRPLPGGNMLLAMNDYGLQWQLLREIDVAGNSVRETTVPRINEQLAALGHDPITAVHHDALPLPNGRMLVLASVERILTDVQGPGPIDVLGDMLIELDADWQVTWAWNAFDHLDASRRALLNEMCTGPSDGCRPLNLAAQANDWMHSNSITYSPADGNVLLSVRHQDWIIKIDYRDGAGAGTVLWRLGKDGDFALAGDQNGWFSHQHDVRFVGSNALLLYDNGNVRCGPTPFTCQSRGQIFEINEAGRTASLRLNVGLGHYSPLMGSAQQLANGNYHFGSGWVYPGPHSEALEFTPQGSRVFSLAVPVAYRSYRMRDIYTP
jgi:arylsulfate sulfotransferase